ncbi:hypothetical protein FB451DRAFT_1396193 [Mycena latifolia]|nr:hypothetical protein FB451DRAFT_1396193 [Mycena latifolia]
MATVALSDATIAQDDRTTRNFFLAGIVLLCYDHLLTLGTEVEYIWTPVCRRSSALYIFVRYFALCANMAMMSLTFATFDYKQLLVGCTLILRVLAMYSFDRRVMITLAAMAIAVVSLAAWFVVPRGPPPTYQTNLPGCHTPASRFQCARLPLHRSTLMPFAETSARLAGAWEAQLAGDVLLLVFTLYHGFTRSRNEIFRPGSLWHVLVRDGAMYFGIICLANLANIPHINTGSSLSSFAAALSVTMICRLLLNLHDAAAIQPELSVFSIPPTVTEIGTGDLFVLDILLELTLAQLPMRDLLEPTARLFFQPDPASECIQNPLLAELFPHFFAPESPNHRSWSGNVKSITAMPWSKAPDAFKREDASWRRMFVTQPPAQTMIITENRHARGGNFERRAVLKN